jgi:hypothetical protein
MTSTYFSGSPLGTTAFGAPTLGTYVGGQSVLAGNTVVGAPVTTYSSGVVGALPTTLVSTGNFGSGGYVSGGHVSGGYVSGGHLGGGYVSGGLVSGGLVTGGATLSTTEVIKGNQIVIKVNQELNTFLSNKQSLIIKFKNISKEFQDKELLLNMRKEDMLKLFQEKLPRLTIMPSSTSNSTSLRSLLRLMSK